MAYVITEDCIRCKYQDCVQVCPVDCFHEGANMLVIDPEECIDCGLCVPECEANAIIEHTDEGGERWLKLNEEYAMKWPIITDKHVAPDDGKSFEGVAGKFEKYFDPTPAE